MPEVTLTQILEAREKRVVLQKKLIKKYNVPVISFTLNIAGPIKTSPLIERAFKEGLREIEKALPEERINARHIDISPVGCQALLSVSDNAASLKRISVSIEEANTLGRLFDIDVLDTDGIKLERENIRGCIVCGAPGRGCAAGRLHPVSQLQEATHKIISNHFKGADSEKIGRLAVRSLLEEVYTTPKPGLVDRHNNGSHNDMNTKTFISGAMALYPYFCECVSIGQNSGNKAYEEIFQLLRSSGTEAEKKMYQATGGVNTHKGLIYSLGIICGAIGYLWKPENPVAHMNEIFALCSLMVKESVKSDFLKANGSTAGEKLYQSHGLTGIRGEAASGFSSVTRFGLPSYEKALRDGYSHNDAGVIALLHLIANVDDTNLYHRGGDEGVKYAKDSVKRVLKYSGDSFLRQVEELDSAFISRNLSPGGCADLLAITYFIYKLQNQM